MPEDDYKAPWPKTPEELLSNIEEILNPSLSLVELSKTQSSTGYNAAANALWKIAVTAFNYASHAVGATGFQAGWAAMQFIREVRQIQAPFIIITADDMLYPQYKSPSAKGLDFERNPEVKDWLKEQATKLLKSDQGVPHVRAHWEKLAE